MQDKLQTRRLVQQILVLAKELVACFEAEDEPRQERTERRLAEGDGFVRLKDFVKELGVSYGTYAKFRAEGKMPQEMRLSKRTIVFSRAEIARWREANGN